ncbi:MAG: hypothetical protein NZN28_11585 [Meiothermus sp.]|uniref:hypothetical protein n=1 Tax=Meiothermus sp. TaxID=1955249 RepID=UPI0025D8D21C|nr:hypothetical protein [Meiothermus sp.]MCS7069254.1 hypothetical protein [Meiothermus sp.]
MRVESGVQSERDPLIARLLQAGAALGWSKKALQGWQAWAATAPLEALRARVGLTEARLSQRRELDPTGCPVHWQRVPLLPARGQQVALQTPDGYGSLYRLEHAGVWYILKFLPPFDGRFSMRDEQGRTWVFPSLDELGRFLNPTPGGFSHCEV